MTGEEKTVKNSIKKYTQVELPLLVKKEKIIIVMELKELIHLQELPIKTYIVIILDKWVLYFLVILPELTSLFQDLGNLYFIYFFI